MVEKTRPSTLIFGLLIFIGIVSSFATFQTEMFSINSVDAGNKTLTILDQTSDLEGLSNDLRERTRTQVTGLEPLDNFIVGTFSAVKFFFSLPDLLATTVSEIGRFLLIPSGILILISVAIMLVITITIIEAITKGEV